jgi:hypothetical protein
MLSVTAVVGTKYLSFSFDSPVITSSNVGNAPLTALTMVTIVGTNFGQTDGTPSIQIGSTLCLTTVWTTDSSVACNLAPGSTTGLDQIVTIEVVSTRSQAFSYDSPVVTFANDINGPTSSGSSITLSGSSFAPLNLTPTVRVGKTLCLTTTWLTTTSTLCQTPKGHGGSIHAAMTLVSLVGTRGSFFSYDSPVVSRLNVFNGPTSVKNSITLNGVNFAAMNTSPTIAIGSSKCGTVEWVSDSTIKCQAFHYDQGKRKHVKITLAGITFTMTNAFTFDSPIVTSVNTGLSNAASTGMSSITMLGTNFGNIDFSPTGRVGPTLCGTTSWTSATTTKCRSPARDARLSGDLGAKLDLYTLIGTLSDVFTFDSPVISNSDMFNLPMQGSASVLIDGQNFGSENMSGTARIGSTLCANTLWVSDTELTCLSPAGYTNGHNAVVTVAMSLGTILSKFTYDAPVPTALAIQNAPNSGGKNLQVFGLNFASGDISGSARLGSSHCETSSWSSSTSISCQVPQGRGTARAMSVTISNTVGTMGGGYTYDSPVVTYVSSFNSATSVGSSITLPGTNFGSTNPSASMRIGSSVCGTVSWNSLTSTQCFFDSSMKGHGSGYTTAVTIAGLMGTQIKSFSYDGPVVTKIVSANLPLSTGSSVTLLGFNFVDSYHMTPTAVVGSTSCATTSWQSGTSVTCHLQVGTGKAHTTKLLMQSHAHGTLMAGFTYDSPVISDSAVINGPPTGGFTITMYGTNFGTINLSATARLGYTACLSSIWVSATRVTCTAPTGVGSARAVGIVIDNVAGSRDSAFTYEPPTPTYSTGTNSPSSGDGLITVVGNNFGLSDTTLSVVLGSTMCNTAYWSSFTSVACTFPAGYGYGMLAKLDISGNKGTNTQPFTYDSPVMTRISQSNCPTSGGAMITVVGTNFGNEDASMQDSRIGSTACGTTSWTSGSSITCTANHYGRGVGHVVTVTLGTVGTFMGSFTYDAPVATSASPRNGATSGAISLSVAGTNFEYNDGTPTLILQTTACGTTSWTSVTSVGCSLSAGGGAGLHAVVMTSDLLATSDGIFSYDAPIVTYNDNTYNVPSSGGAILTVSGVNFGYVNLTPTVKVGKTTCKTTQWSSLTALRCEAPFGYGSNLHTSVSVVSVAGTKTAQLTYDAPLVTNIFKMNMPMTSGALVTIHGSNFGFEDTTPLPKIGATRCATTSWNSETTLICRTPSGYGTKLHTSLTVGVLIGTFTDTFTFDAAVVTSSLRGNQPNTGTGFVTVSGMNFAAVDTTISVFVGLTACATSSWNSATALQCYTPIGRDTVSMQVETLNTQIGTRMNIFTYDSPVISALMRPNAAQTGQTSITLVGANFGGADLTVTTNMGASICDTTSWTTASMVRCRITRGSSKLNSAVLTIGSLVGTAMKSFSYDSPTLTYINRFNAALTGGYTISIIGQNFGLDDYSLSARIGLSMCSTVSWSSQSQVLCQTTAGSGTMLNGEFFMSSYQATGHAIFSYDAPILSLITVTASSANGAVTAGGTMTMLGTNFGSHDLSSTVSIGKTACTKSEWIAMTSMRCQIAPGAGTFLATTAVVNTAIGTFGSAFTYDSPVFSSIEAPNSPTSGLAPMTIHGYNLGSDDATPSLRIGSTLCQTTVWTSNSQVTCYTAASVGRDLTMHLLLENVVGTRWIGFSYDSPTSSQALHYNVPTTSGTSVTVTGMNFGSYDLTLSIRLSTFLCATSTWTSSSTVNCMSGAGGGGPVPIVVQTAFETRMVDAIEGTFAHAFSYDSPILSYHPTTNGPVTSGVLVSISGSNFVSNDLTPSVQVAMTTCATTSWTSTTAVTCTTAQGVGAMLNLGVLVESVFGTSRGVYTYDSPVLSFSRSSNAPTSGAAMVTVEGLGFATANFSPSLVIQQTTVSRVCATTAWQSVSTLTCEAPAAIRQASSSHLIIGSVPGTSLTVFTYDTPAVSVLSQANAPTSGGTDVTLLGLNFVNQDSSPVLRLGSTDCTTSVWVTSSSITCKSAVGTGIGRTAALSIDDHVGTSQASFTFDTPVVTYAAIYNSATSGSASVTVNGMNFGSMDSTVTIKVGSVACKTSSWITGTTIVCESPIASTPANMPRLGVVVSGNEGHHATLFTYDSGVVTGTNVRNGPVTGSSSISITGLNFGSTNLSPSLIIGGVVCKTSQWISETSALCAHPPGMDSLASVVTEVASLLGTATGMFSYDAPVVTSSDVSAAAYSTSNGPASGNYDMTIIGANFGDVSRGAKARIGSTACRTTAWKSDSTVVCRMPDGTGKAKSVPVTLGRLVGTQYIAFSYDSPTVTYINRNNGPTSGAASVTLYGFNFALYSTSGTVHIGETKCSTTAWFTGTKMLCAIAPGLSAGTSVAIESDGASSIGTFHMAFTYDAPVTSYTTTPNMPASGGTVVTVLGRNFGVANPSGTVKVGMTVCAQLTYSSDTAVKCMQGPQGTGKALTVEMTTKGNLKHQSENSFSFDAPVVTYFRIGTPLQTASNGPNSLSFSLTIEGSNFGTSNVNPAAQFGGYQCAKTEWISDTSLLCGSNGGAGSASAIVNTNGVMGTSLEIFSFDTPVITHLNRVNTPTSKGSVVSIHGMNFGLVDLTPTIQIGFTTCLSTSWSTATSVSCTTADGAGAARHVAVTVYQSVGTGSGAFTYDAPVITFSSTVNMPTAGGAPLTVTGFNFGPMTLKQKANLYAGESTLKIGYGANTNVCSSGSSLGDWISDTSFVCLSSPIGSGANVRLFGDNADSVGTSKLAFTYDAPTLTNLARPNAPPTSGASITLHGINFANVDATVSVNLGLSPCATTSWSTGTSLTCSVTSGTGSGLRVPVVVDKLVGTATGGFTYNPPVVTVIESYNGPSNGGVTITMAGVNFGGYNTNPVGQIGQTGCSATGYVSPTSLTCVVSPGVGAAILAGAQVTGNLGGATKGFSYDGPRVTSVFGINAPTSGGKTMTINGANFGLSNSSPFGIVADAYCATSQWISSTSVVCSVPDGVGKQQFVGIDVGGNLNTMETVFTYDAAIVSGILPSNGAVSGSTITLLGSNFGVKPKSSAGSSIADPIVSVGGVSCESSAWVSNSHITCTVPAGFGSGKTVEVSVAQTFDSNGPKGAEKAAATLARTEHAAVYKSAFSYDIPVITRMLPSNGPVQGGATITVMGFNFGTPTPKKTAVVLGSTACPTVTWVSNHEILCKMAAGTSAFLTASVNVDGAQGNTAKSAIGFSYNSPVVSQAAMMNAPTTGGVLIELHGLNFGDNAKGAKLTGKIGVTDCAATAWLSPTSITCRVPTGTGAALDAKAVLDGNVGGQSPIFSYDSPVLTHISSPGTTNDGSFSMTILGTNFGSANRNPTVQGGDEYCTTTSWISDSQLVCRSVLAAGSQTIKVTVSDQIGQRAHFFSVGTTCPNNCYQASGNGECKGGICDCSINKAYGLKYEGRDCSLGYCGTTNTPYQLTGTSGTLSDHTEMTYWYKPWSRPGSKCSWQIAPKSGTFIRLTFTKFDLAEGVDFVKVFAKTELIATISGTGIPAPIETNKGELTVTYTSASGLKTGFAASYTASKCPMGCSQDIGNGKCNLATETCDCEPGWRGAGCDVGFSVLDLDLSDPDVLTKDDSEGLQIKGAVFAFGCASSAAQTLDFVSKGERSLTTDLMDFSQGGSTDFDIKVSSGSGTLCSKGTANRRRRAGSNVEVQYQVDGTTTWTTLQSIGPSPYQTLQPVSVKMPDSAKSSKVRLRFIQPGSASLPRGQDGWALGSVKVATPFICPKGSNGKECSGNGQCFGTGTCLCNRMFFGKACDQACFINYWHEEVCGCPVPVDPYSSA